MTKPGDGRGGNGNAVGIGVSRKIAQIESIAYLEDYTS